MKNILFSEFGFVTEANVTDYITYVPLGTGGYQYHCNLCGHRSNDRSNLKKHIRNVHLASKQEMCKYCHRVYKNRGSLKSHLKSRCSVRDANLPWKNAWNFEQLTSFSILRSFWPYIITKCLQKPSYLIRLMTGFDLCHEILYFSFDVLFCPSVSEVKIDFYKLDQRKSWTYFLTSFCRQRYAIFEDLHLQRGWPTVLPMPDLLEGLIPQWQHEETHVQSQQVHPRPLPLLQAHLQEQSLLGRSYETKKMFKEYDFWASHGTGPILNWAR